MSSSSPKPLFFRVFIGNWDLVSAAIIAGVFFWVMLCSDKYLEDLRVMLLASVPFGVAIAGAAMVTGRWVSDRVKDTPYGQVLRRLDPKEMRVQQPTYIVAFAGLFTSFVGVVLLIVHQELDRTWTIIFLAMLLFMVMYDLLGLADLIRVGRRHLARMSELQSMREEEERRRRQGGK